MLVVLLNLHFWELLFFHSLVCVRVVCFVASRSCSWGRGVFLSGENPPPRVLPSLCGIQLSAGRGGREDAGGSRRMMDVVDGMRVDGGCREKSSINPLA